MARTSVALATFNGEKYLGAQLESLARQTVLPCELVVTDDRSTDGTINIVREFARNAPFPVHLDENTTRLGYRANFMHATELCKADLIAYCDQDDIWEPEKIAVMEGLFDNPEILLAYHNAVVVSEDGEPIGYLYASGPVVKTFAPLGLEPWSLVTGFTQVFRSSLRRFATVHEASIDPYWPAQRLAHDQWHLFLASVFGSVVRVGQSLVRYRQHGENVFGWENKHSLETAPSHILQPESFIAAARNRSELLRGLRSDLGEEQRSRADRAIAFYDDLARRLDDRMSMYSSAALPARIRKFDTLLRQDAYSRAKGAARFGWKGLLLDAFGGVLLGPVVKRLIL